MKIYLGDSVYAELEERMIIKLYTDNGIGLEENIIYLEREVYEALKMFAKKIGW